MTAHEHLSRALAALLAADRRPPCCDGSGRWLSEDTGVRVQAAEECAGCALTEPCRAAGLVEQWGVWGGQDRSAQTPARSRRTRRARRCEVAS